MTRPPASNTGAADAEEALVRLLVVHGVAALADELQLALQVGHVGDGALRHGGKADLVKAVAGAFGVHIGEQGTCRCWCRRGAACRRRASSCTRRGRRISWRLSSGSLPSMTARCVVDWYASASSCISGEREGAGELVALVYQFAEEHEPDAPGGNARVSVFCMRKRPRSSAATIRETLALLMSSSARPARKCRAPPCQRSS